MCLCSSPCHDNFHYESSILFWPSHLFFIYLEMLLCVVEFSITRTECYWHVFHGFRTSIQIIFFFYLRSNISYYKLLPESYDALGLEQKAAMALGSQVLGCLLHTSF